MIGLSSRYDQVIVLCSWGKQFTLMVPLSTLECNWLSTEKLSGKPDEILEGSLMLDWHPMGGVLMLVVTSCYGNWKKLQLNGSFDSCTDLTFHHTPQEVNMQIAVLRGRVPVSISIHLFKPIAPSEAIRPSTIVCQRPLFWAIFSNWYPWYQPSVLLLLFRQILKPFYFSEAKWPS